MKSSKATDEIEGGKIIRKYGIAVGKSGQLFGAICRFFCNTNNESVKNRKRIGIPYPVATLTTGISQSGETPTTDNPQTALIQCSSRTSAQNQRKAACKDIKPNVATTDSKRSFREKKTVDSLKITQKQSSKARKF